jgi:hypothetical protein
MKSAIIGLIGSLSWTLAQGAYTQHSTRAQFDPKYYACNDVVVRDVLVVGGGASGTYGAITLKDLGLSVAVIEKKDVFGGHTHTYPGPNGVPIDYGVRQYIGTDVAKAFFKRFSIPSLPLSFGGFAFVDFQTGATLPGFFPDFNFTGYAAQLSKYPNLSMGLWQLPQPFPADLLLPFGQFAVKYQVQNVVYTVGSLIWGAGTLLTRSTAFVFSQFGSGYVNELSGTSGFRTDNNSALYFKAQAELGESAFVSSTIVDARRTSRGVAVVIKSPSGRKLLLASQLLFSAPLLLENTAALGLDEREFNVFKEFQGAAYYVMLLNGTGLNSSLVSFVKTTNLFLPTLTESTVVQQCWHEYALSSPRPTCALFDSSNSSRRLVDRYLRRRPSPFRRPSQGSSNR